MLSNEELLKIEERVNAATAGPWKSWRDGNQFIGHRSDNDTMNTCVGASIVKGIFRPWNPAAMIAFGWKPEENEVCRFKDDDADFIAHSRQDVPALLSHIKEQAAEIERLRGMVEPKRIILADKSAPVIGFTKDFEGTWQAHTSEYKVGFWTWYPEFFLPMPSVGGEGE